MVPQWCLLQFFFLNSYPFSYLSNIYFILRLAGQLAKELSICDMQLKTLLKPYSLYSLSLRLLTLSKDQVNLAQYCVCLCVCVYDACMCKTVGNIVCSHILIFNPFCNFGDGVTEGRKHFISWVKFSRYFISVHKRKFFPKYSR